MSDVGLLELCRRANLSAEIGDEVSHLESVEMVVNAKMLLLAVKRTNKTLFVRYSGSGWDEDGIREDMPYLYNELWDACLDCGKVNLDCVVLVDQVGTKDFLGDTDAGKTVQVVFNAGRRIDEAASTSEAVGIPVESLENDLKEECFGVKYVLYDNKREKMPHFDKVALGGTFDHFHNGHKKLLSIGCSICRKELIVGVTDDSMLGEKKLRDLIEDIEVRKNHVKNFLRTTILCNPTLKCDPVVIKDVWGPTVVDAEVEALVCSTETLKGARMINEERGKRGMKPLSIVAVARSNAYTLSSTFVRKLRQNSSSI